jgi:hypothetical protein
MKKTAVISALMLLAAVARAAPVNDNLADRIVLLGTNASVSSSNVGATKETGETNHAAAFGQTAAGMSVWYSWTPDVGGYVALTLTGNFNKVFAVYTGSSVDSLSRAGGGFNNSPYIANGSFVSAAGTEYLIAVDGYSYGSGAFTLSLAETPPPPNDNFADRIPIIGTNTTLTGSNVSASKEPGEPNHAGVAGGQSVWWTWTAPASGWTTFKSSGNFSMLLGVYTGDSVATLTPVASGKGTSYSAPAIAGLNATAGTVYQIAVDGATLADYSSSFSLQVVLLAPPANDNFANSAVLTGSNVDLYNMSNLSATKEPGEPNHAGNPGGHSVWWVWTAPVSGRYTLFSDLWMGSLPPLDRLLGVYTGSSVSALTEVASATARSNTVAKATFGAIQGTVYHFAADGLDGASGAFNLYLRLPPPNDDFTNRLTVANTNIAISGTNAYATGEPGEPNHATDASPPTSVWWKWVAPVSGRAVVSVSSSYSQYLGVYTGTTVSSLSVVASGNGNGNSPAYGNFDAVAGTEYEIAVDGGGGPFSLTVQYVQAPANDAFANSRAVTNTTGASFYVMDSNLGATKEAGETWQGTASVWWTWTAPTNGEILIELESTVYGTTMTFPWLGLYRGTTVSNLTSIYPRVEFAGMQHYHDARYPVTAGTTYYVWVANRGGVEGIYTLRGTFEPPPVNDNFTNRIVLTNTPFLYQYGYMVLSAYNCCATKEAGEPWHGGPSYYYGGKSVWWTWTAPYSGRLGVTVSPVHYGFSSMAGVYTGAAVSNLTRVTNTYSTCTDGSCVLYTPVVAGTTYQIAADGGGGYGDSGEFTLSLSGYFDTNAPSVTITNPLSGQATNATLIIGGTAADLPGTGAFTLASGVNLVEVRLNGGTWQAATGTNSWSRAVTLANGANLIEVRARDSVGNYSATASVTSTFGTLISGLQMVNGQPQVTFPSVLGNSYQLQWSDCLATPITWNPVLPDAIPGTGSAMIFTDTNAPSFPQRFYRLLVK